jgi:hypothetical protein
VLREIVANRLSPPPVKEKTGETPEAAERRRIGYLQAWREAIGEAIQDPEYLALPVGGREALPKLGKDEEGYGEPRTRKEFLQRWVKDNLDMDDFEE